MALITAYLDTHLWVPWQALDIRKVEADLLVSDLAAERSSMFGNSTKATKLALWEDVDGWAVLPRGYSPPLLPNTELRVVRRTPPPTNRYPWFFARKLRPHQVPATEALLAQRGDKLLCMGCGKGKTSVALWYAAQKGQKTLVIVDRDFLVDQWKTEIAATLRIPLEQIGHVQANKLTIGNKITIAMVHTLAQRDFSQDFYDQFELVIVDEAHVMAATTFSTVIPRFRGERLLLTATPFRRDGLAPLFMYHSGGMTPVYTDLSRSQSARWYFKRIPPVLTEAELARCYRPMPNGAVRRIRQHGVMIKERQMMLVRAKYETAAANSIIMNSYVITEIERAARAGRNTLCLGSRVEQLRTLHEYFQEADLDSGLVTGEVKGEKRLEAFGHQCLFITNQIGNKALDVPRLDTLYMLYPTDDEGFIRQAVGRVDRELEEKREAVVVVFHHSGVPSLEAKSVKMSQIIHNIDPRAEVRWI